MIPILVLIWIHFVADFILQTDKIAINKSSSNTTLLKHVVLYSLPFLPFGFVFAITNGILHFLTDWVTSRWTKKLWAQEKRHDFFVVIGLDQAIHMSCLVLTYYWLVA